RWQQAPDDNFRVKQKLNRYETRIGIFETKTTDIFRTFHPINNSDISVTSSISFIDILDSV
ncbi:MAG: hypothetical protein O9294_16895, partial [Cytophagales bacterium]|nr:hypothetical protein [Cytophagales bacterium]